MFMTWTRFTLYELTLRASMCLESFAGESERERERERERARVWQFLLTILPATLPMVLQPEEMNALLFAVVLCCVHNVK